MLARPVQDVMHERDEGRFPRRPRRRLPRRRRGDGEDGGPAIRAVLPLRMVAGPWPADPADLREAAWIRVGRSSAGGGLPRGWDHHLRDAPDVGLVRPTTAPRGQDAFDEP